MDREFEKIKRLARVKKKKSSKKKILVQKQCSSENDDLRDEIELKGDPLDLSAQSEELAHRLKKAEKLSEMASQQAREMEILALELEKLEVQKSRIETQADKIDSKMEPSKARPDVVFDNSIQMKRALVTSKFTSKFNPHTHDTGVHDPKIMVAKLQDSENKRKEKIKVQKMLMQLKETDKIVKAKLLQKAREKIHIHTLNSSSKQHSSENIEDMPELHIDWDEKKIRRQAQMKKLEEISQLLRQQHPPPQRDPDEAESGWSSLESQILARRSREILYRHARERGNMSGKMPRTRRVRQRSIERGERRKAFPQPEIDTCFSEDEDQLPFSVDQKDREGGAPDQRASPLSHVSMQELLEKCRCEEYAEAFENAGHEDAAKILQASEEERHKIGKSIGMKPGHIARFKHAIDTILQEQGASN